MKLTAHERETLDINMEMLIERITSKSDPDELDRNRARLQVMLDTTGMLNVRLSKKIMERLRRMSQKPCQK